MKQEYTDKMNYYNGKEYEKFLREKCVLDAYQFLYSFYYKVEVLGGNYDVHKILNKLTLEWVSHISNSLDCLLQYINAALNLGLKQKAVTERNIYIKLKHDSQIYSCVKNLWEDEIVC